MANSEEAAKYFPTRVQTPGSVTQEIQLAEIAQLFKSESSKKSINEDALVTAMFSWFMDNDEGKWITIFDGPNLQLAQEISNPYIKIIIPGKGKKNEKSDKRKPLHALLINGEKGMNALKLLAFLSLGLKKRDAGDQDREEVFGKDFCDELKTVYRKHLHKTLVVPQHLLPNQTRLVPVLMETSYTISQAENASGPKLPSLDLDNASVFELEKARSHIEKQLAKQKRDMILFNNHKNQAQQRKQGLLETLNKLRKQQKITEELEKIDEIVTGNLGMTKESFELVARTANLYQLGRNKRLNGDELVQHTRAIWNKPKKSETSTVERIGESGANTPSGSNVNTDGNDETHVD